MNEADDVIRVCYVNYICLSEDKINIHVQTYVVDQARSQTIKLYIDEYHLLQQILVFGPHVLKNGLFWRGRLVEWSVCTSTSWMI